MIERRDSTFRCRVPRHISMFEHLFEQVNPVVPRGPGTAEARDLAEVVVQDTSEFDWRIVDGALNHRPSRRTSGKRTCDPGVLGGGPHPSPSPQQT